MKRFNSTNDAPRSAERRTALRFAGAAAVVVATSGLTLTEAYAADSLIYKGYLSNKAVSGYDPVAYFTQGKPVKGVKKYKLEHEGADWYFASETNLELFKANPEQFSPQYGGYCAYAVGIGQTAKGNPKNWDIVEGKLYLNYNRKFQNIWKKDQASFIERGDANWPSVVQ